MPASALYFPTRKATAGVGTTPSCTTLAPTLQRPAVMAASSMSEDLRVSLPIKILGWRRSSSVSTIAAARPMFMAISQVSSLLAMPRTPSVPNNLPIPYHS